MKSKTTTGRVTLQSFNREHPEIPCEPKDIQFKHRVVLIEPAEREGDRMKIAYFGGNAACRLLNWNWQGLVLTFCALSISAAGLSYTWRTVREYRLREAAAIRCRAAMPAENISDVQEAAEYWLEVRGCINRAMGAFDTNGIESAISSLDITIGAK